MLRGDFAKDVYEKLGIPFSHVNRIIGIAWAAIEGSDALNNPWDTTEPWEGATEFNSVGVKNYLTWQDGVDATVATLTNGFYNHVIRALKNDSATVLDKLNAINDSPWGSHISEQLYGDVLNNIPKYDTKVAGSHASKDELVDSAEEPVKEEEVVEPSRDSTTDAPGIPNSETVATPVEEQPLKDLDAEAKEEEVPPPSRDSTGDMPTNTTVDDSKPLTEAETADLEKMAAERKAEAEANGLPPANTSDEPTFTNLPNLKEGDKDRAVFVATTLLKAWGYYEGDPTSDFTSEVTAAVKKFQEFFRIAISGEINAEFWSAFFYQ